MRVAQETSAAGQACNRLQLQDGFNNEFVLQSLANEPLQVKGPDNGLLNPLKPNEKIITGVKTVR